VPGLLAGLTGVDAHTVVDRFVVEAVADGPLGREEPGRHDGGERVEVAR
jgi:hypothetical protein